MLIDLSHDIVHGMTTYPGLPGPDIGDHLSHEDSRPHYGPGTTFQIGRIEMVASTGTYIDSPYHRHPAKADLAGFDLARVADLPVAIVRIPEGAPRAVRADAFAGLDVAGCAVLVHTGWSRLWGADAYFGDWPHLTRAAAECLRDAGARLVGIDSVNIDTTHDPKRPVHTALLGADIPIVEHLTNLAAVPDAGARFFAVPPKVRGMGSFPVRAFALARG